jgi:hypothetical protein
MGNVASYYSTLSDSDLLAAHAEGQDVYHADAWKIVNDELSSRGLEVERDQAEPIELPKIELKSSSETNCVAPKPEALCDDLGLDDETNDLLASQTEINVATRQRKRGVFWLVLGTSMTALSYAIASDGGSYYLYYGAMLIGGFNLVRGNLRLERARGIDPRTGKPAT